MNIDQSFPQHPDPSIKLALDSLFRTLQNLKVGSSDIDVNEVSQAVAGNLPKPKSWPSLRALLRGDEPFTQIFVSEDPGEITVQDRGAGTMTIRFGSTGQAGSAGLHLDQTKSTTDGNCLRLRQAGTDNIIYEEIHGAKLTSGGQWTNGSHSSIKEGIKPLYSRTVLEKLKRLPISEWQCKSNPTERHAGPMAEQFYALFGLGDDRGISALDMASLAVKGIQELSLTLEETREALASALNRVGELEDILSPTEEDEENDD